MHISEISLTVSEQCH